MSDTGGVHTACPYCGVGCGVVARPDGTIAGDQAHPSNRGRLCSKGAALGATLDDGGRLTEPLVDSQAVSWDTALDLVAERFRATIADHGPDSVAFYVSGQCLTEDYYVANKLMKGFIGSGNIDTNSRLCMASSVAGHVRAFGEDVVPGVYEDFEEADLIVLVGSNTAWCHPVLHQRLLAARAAHGTKVVVLDPRRTATAEGADLHLPLAIGSDVALFNGLLAYLDATGAVDRAWVARHAVGLEDALAAAISVSCPAAGRAAAPSSQDAPQSVGDGAARRAGRGRDCDTGRNSDIASMVWSGGTGPRHVNTDDGPHEPTLPDLIDAVAAECGVDPEVLETFYAWFAGTERVLTVYSQGVNQSSVGTDKVNAIINCHLATGRIGRPGMGPFSVTGQPNAMGGREVGGLANQLAAHMRFDDPADRAALRAFWQAPALAPKPGLKAIELFDAIADGRVKAVWIVATNPADSLPRAGHARKALAACPFVVVSDCWPTDTTDLAHVVLPAAGWGEKDGTVTNSERRISRQRGFREAPGKARADWWMFAEVGRRMGWADAFAWGNSAAVFREHAALSGHVNAGRRVFDISALATLDDADYEALQPVRWPLPAGAASEGGRLFAHGGFPTADGRARLVPTPYHGQPDRSGRPFLLNTGRVRDQWHTMTRTGLAPRLMNHTSEPRLTLHPADAAMLELAQDDLARIETDHGSVLLRADLRHTQRRGEMFAPMHWTDRFASSGPVGQTVGAIVDPVSGQPQLKATPAAVTRVMVRFHGLLLRRSDGPLPGIGHWVRMPIDEGQLYRLAGLDALPEDVALDSLVETLLAAPGGSERLEMADRRRGIVRVAAVFDGAVEACLFLARDAAGLPSEAAVIPMLGAPIPDSERPRLLAGRLYDRNAAEGPRVCACFGVSRDAVRHAVVTNGLHTVAEIGVALRAGTNCGSCIPELQEILRDVRVPAA
jgi:assimilatory nitrate reductase catalytic subunit